MTTNSIEQLCSIMGSLLLTSSEFQTKIWRQENICKKDGQRDSSSEKYQRKLVEEITKTDCPKSNGMRINNRTLEMKKNHRPMTKNKKCVPDGFDWSEDFDGLQTIKTKSLFYSFKFVTEGGGGQTRTLREVYHFIETQLKYLKKNDNNILFINILDGDCSFQRKECFKYLLQLEEYADINNKCFVGDMTEFNQWFSKFNR